VKAGRSASEPLDSTEIPDTSDVLALAEWMAQPRQPKAKKGRVVEQAEYRQYTVLVAAFCGLRLGEMLALRGRHVNGDVLTVSEQVQYVRGQGNIVVTPKWGSSRKVLVPAKAGRWNLAEWLAKRAKQVGPDGLLFPAPNGGLWVATNYRKHVLDPARAAVWPGRKWSYHSMRHTFCTSLLTQGVSINDVAAMAGHSSPLVTANIYIGKQASAIDRVRKVLNEG
jgi:integrase